jgi:hypothetical protein
MQLQILKVILNLLSQGIRISEQEIKTTGTSTNKTK